MLPAADRVAAILPAAGSGSRLGAQVPKAFIELDGLTLLTRSALTMSRYAETLVVAAPEGELRRAGRLLSDVDADVIVVAGGVDRQASVAACLAAIPESIEHILVHDAARPLTPTAVVERVLSALVRGARAAIPVLPVVDTIRRVDDAVAGDVVDRSGLRRVQTPQGFDAATLRAAYQRASDSATDDAALVQRIGVPVSVVPGDERALKITTTEDLVVAHAYLEER